MALPALNHPQIKVAQPPARELMMERHFSVSELAEKWGYSVGFILKEFESEPRIRSPRRKQGALRFPESVVERVYDRLLKAGVA